MDAHVSEPKRISVDEFLKYAPNFNGAPIQFTPYVSIAVKMAIARKIAEDCGTVKDKDGKVLGYQRDSILLHVQETIATLTLYTNLQLFSDDGASDPTVATEVYDRLASSLGLAWIMERLKGNEFSDYWEWKKILDLAKSDFECENLSTYGHLKRTTARIVNWLTRAGNTILEFVEPVMTAFSTVLNRHKDELDALENQMEAGTHDESAQSAEAENEPVDQDAMGESSESSSSPAGDDASTSGADVDDVIPDAGADA